jgi:hypothetical protein
MKTKIWVLATVLADENAPALPIVFADEAEAWANIFLFFGPHQGQARAKAWIIAKA